MSLFSTLYNKVLLWSKHPKAPYLLAGVSFAESSVFPIPPDVMLISMGLVKRESVWFYAFIATLFSVLGAILGYLIGAFFFHVALGYMQTMGYMEKYHYVQSCFLQWGVLIILIAGFTPIPYKLFTITAGSMHMLLLPFILASVVGRGARFFLVSLILHLGGETLHKQLQAHIEKIGWGLVLLVTIFILYHYLPIH